MAIISDNEAVTAIIQDYIDETPKAGGFIHADLVFNCQVGELSLSGVTGEKSLFIPKVLFIPIEKVEESLWWKAYEVLGKLKDIDLELFKLTRVFGSHIIPLFDMANHDLSPGARYAESSEKGVTLYGSEFKYNNRSLAVNRTRYGI